MGLKKYILASIILILAVFGYAFSIESGDYRIQFLDFTTILPIAIWIVIPTIVLFVMTIVHILFYGLKNYFEIKSIEKDTTSLANLISKKLLNKNDSSVFKNKNLKKVALVMSQLEISVKNKDFSSSNIEIDKIVNQLFSIEDGKYISSKELKLDNTNPIMVKNLINRVNNDENFALEVVKDNSKYSQETVKLAFSVVLEKKSITTVKKVIEEITLDEEMILKLFKKDSEQKSEFSMTNDKILEIIKKVKLTNKELIEIANYYKVSMTPDQLIKLYEDIATSDEEYTVAYLYVLAQYEMIDKMRDILVNSATDEYIAFKALVDLKDAGKHSYSLDTLSYK